MKRLLLLGVLLLACHRSDPDSSPPPADAPKADVSLLVRNHHWLDINIYMMRGNVKQRLGTVTGTSEKRFTIPWSKLNGQTGLQLIADPVGQSGELVTETIALRPGAEVEWTIEYGMRSSSISVY